MAEEISSMIAAARAKLQAELDLQLDVLADQHRQTVDLARRTAEQDAEQRWLTKLKAAEEAATAAASRARVEMEQELSAARANEERHRTSRNNVVSAIRQIESASTVSETLNAIALAASATGSRSSLFLFEADHVTEWTANGAQPLTHGPLGLEDPSAGVLSAAVRTRAMARDAAPAALAAGETGRSAIAIPLLLEGVPVAVLYGDQEEGAALDSSWTETLELAAAHGATRLGYLTAVRTAQAMRWIVGGAAPASDPTTPISRASSGGEPRPGSDEEEQSARRYARLLISEIKLYNEAAVRTGREKRDLLTRLQPEVERARRLYEHRVPVTLRARAQYFDHELVQTLAGGDALLLG